MTINFDNLLSITPIDDLPYAKYGLSDGKLRTGDGRNITKSSFIADLRNLKIGWLNFSSPPQFSLVRISEPLPPKPSEEHDSGLQFAFRLENAFGGEKFVISHTSKLFGDAVADLYREYRSRNKPDELPVVSLGEPRTITTARGIFYQPVFIIEKWVLAANFDAPPPPEGSSAPTFIDDFFKDAA